MFPRGDLPQELEDRLLPLHLPGVDVGHDQHPRLPGRPDRRGRSFGGAPDRQRKPAAFVGIAERSHVDVRARLPDGFQERQHVVV